MKPIKKTTPTALVVSSLISVVGIAATQAATVAYYRFEEGTAGNAVTPATNSVVDSAGGDDNMNAFGSATAPIYRALVPAPTVPQTGASNNLSIQLDGANDDVYTALEGPLRTTVFSSFTVEAYVRFSGLAGFQTIVGRDDTGGTTTGQNGFLQSLFYLSKSGVNNNFRVELTNASGGQLAVDGNITALTDLWYHVAAVGNGTNGTLELFVNGISAGSTPGFAGLFDPADNNSWTIGRGQYSGNIGDFVNGHIDEVRFSDTALAPDQFLNAIPEPGSFLLGSLGALALLRRRR